MLSDSTGVHLITNTGIRDRRAEEAGERSGREGTEALRNGSVEEEDGSGEVSDDLQGGRGVEKRKTSTE